MKFVLLFVVSLCAMGICATGLCAQDNSLDKFAFEFKDWSKHASLLYEDAFDFEGKKILLLGGTLTLGAFSLDQQTHDRWKDHQQMSSNVSQWGDLWGSGIPEFFILLGQSYFDPENGVAGLEGFLGGGLIVHTAKFAIGRKRPDSEVQTSMPSGHSQAAFSLAASMTQSYGWKRSIPFWGMGVLTGLSRLADNKHWLSDVVAGTTLGILFGRSAYKHHHKNSDSANYHIMPCILFDKENNADGLFLSFQWRPL